MSILFGKTTSATSPPEADVSAQVATADALRDERRFAEAAEAYRLALDMDAGLGSIWVQYGHALKEIGRIREAEDAYRTATEVLPTDDAFFQLGHALLMQHRTWEATEAFSSAVELNPRHSGALRELRRLDAPLPASQVSPRVLFDLSDVFFYLRHHSTVSGIQRVQLGLSEAILKADDFGRDVAFLAAPADGEDYVEIPATTVRKLLKTLERPSVTVEDLSPIVNRIDADGIAYEPQSGDLLLIVGAFWVMPGLVEKLIVHKRNGVRIGLFVHDLIPITHPEYCVRDLVDTFTFCLEPALRIADVVVSISENTQREVEKLIARRGFSKPRMIVLRNAHYSWNPKPSSSAKPSPAIRYVLARPYVLYVSTIEVRKNHTLLYRVWKRMIAEESGPVPDLVFLGRPGWRVQDLMDQIEATEHLDGHITILHGVSDSDLAHLYKNALFTTFPSFEEGWGLPIGESLVFGRPVISSNLSSMPEVGGDFVDYVDPYDVASAYEVFRRMIFDTGYREQRARNIADNFTPRTWDDVAGELVAHIRALDLQQGEDEEASYHVELPARRLHRVGHGDDRSTYINQGIGRLAPFIFDTHWYPAENFGRWLRGGAGTLTFVTAQRSQSPVRILLGVVTVPWYEGLPLDLWANETKLGSVVLQPDSRRYLALTAVPDQHGTVKLGLAIRGPIAPGPDERKDLSVGLTTIGYASGDDIAARIDMLEALLGDRGDLVVVER